MCKTSIDDLKKYYEKLTELVQQNSDVPILNEDRAHNAVVMRVILENSEKIKMYCGEFSVFRTEFAIKASKTIDEEIIPEGETDADNLFMIEAIEGYLTDDGDKPFNPIGGLYKSLLTFLKKDNTEMEVIVENPEGLKKESIYSKIIFPYRNKIKFYKTEKGRKIEDYYSHFTIGDNRMYRMELEKESHEAICCFYNIKGVESLNTSFDYIKSNSIPLS